MRRLLTLNVNRCKERDALGAFLRANSFSFLCLQEVEERNLSFLQEMSGSDYAYWMPTQNILGLLPVNPNWTPQGIAFLGKGAVPSDFEQVYYGQWSECDANRGERSPWMGVQAGALIAQFDDITIVTTHGPRTNDGVSTTHQQLAYQVLIHSLRKINGPLIVAGDFNAPRGGESYFLFSTSVPDLVDIGLDSSVVTTLDPVLHYAKDSPTGVPKLVVDHIFGRVQREGSVQVHGGVSDHLGLSIEFAV